LNGTTKARSGALPRGSRGLGSADFPTHNPIQKCDFSYDSRQKKHSF
jgi:hypothetical protein